MMKTKSNKTDERQDRFLPIFLAVIGELERYPFGMALIGRTYKPDEYRYGFGGHEKDDEVSGDGNHLAFGDYGYDTRLGRRWNIEPNIFKYSSFSSYLVFANNPIYFKDPGGLDAEFAISSQTKNGKTTTTVTFSTIIVISGKNADAKHAAAYEKNVDKRLNNKSHSSTIGSKTYNVKFDIQVKTTAQMKAEGLSLQGANVNYVTLKEGGKNDRSNVTGKTGVWNVNDTNGFAHEIGHLLGLADRYKDYIRPGDNLEPRDMPYINNVGNTEKNDIMGEEARNGVLSQAEIDAFVNHAIKNQKDGKGIIKTSTLNKPTEKEINEGKIERSDKVDNSHKNSLK